MKPPQNDVVHKCSEFWPLSQLRASGASFQKRDELHKGLRHARHGRYLIFFIEVGDEVQIVRVIQGSRDLSRLFER